VDYRHDTRFKNSWGRQFGNVVKEFNVHKVSGDVMLDGFLGGFDDCARFGCGRRVHEGKMGRPYSKGNEEQADRYDGTGNEPFVLI